MLCGESAAGFQGMVLNPNTAALAGENRVLAFAVLRLKCSRGARLVLCVESAVGFQGIVLIPNTFDVSLK